MDACAGTLVLPAQVGTPESVVVLGFFVQIIADAVHVAAEEQVVAAFERGVLFSGKPIVDAGGLNGRGIDGVDVRIGAALRGRGELVQR